jgi:ketosteroid isomerase-like protein
VPPSQQERKHPPSCPALASGRISIARTYRTETTALPWAVASTVRPVGRSQLVPGGRLLGSSVDARSGSQNGSHRPCVILRCPMTDEPTTPELVELVRRQAEAANRRDLDAATSSFAPDAVFEGRALGEIFEGRADIRSFIEEWFGAYEELEYGLEEVRDLGKGVVFAVVVQNGRPVGSAGHVRQREGWSTSGWEA